MSHAGTDEHRGSLDDTTIDQLDTDQPVGIDDQPSDLTAHDAHPACLQLDKLG